MKRLDQMPSDANWIAQLENQRRTSDRNWTTAVLLSVFFGPLGADRFYLGCIGLGILKLLTIGGYFVWWAVDIVLLLTERMKDDKGRIVRKT